MKHLKHWILCLAAALLLALPAHAAETPGVVMSQSTVAPVSGDQVTVKFSLSGYTGEEDLIRGLQLTVSGLDPDAITVEQCRSLIDAPEVPDKQNMAVYSEENRLVNLIYAPLEPSEETTPAALGDLLEIVFCVHESASIHVKCDIVFQSGNRSQTADFTIRCGDGLYEADGELWYYVNGEKTGAGLIRIGEDYYYIKTNGAAVRGMKYYVSKTNELRETGVYTFDENGKMVIPEVEVKNGLVHENGGIWYYEDGVRTNAGLISIDGYYYYVKSDGSVVTNKRYYVSKTNGLMPRAMHTFDGDGKMTDPPVMHDGLVEENGRLYYYENGVRCHPGLIRIGDDYYYINNSCYAVTNCSYYVSNTNELMPKGVYAFGEDGKMILPTEEVKNGLYEENNGLYYYVDGVRTNAGLVFLNGNYYYIKSDGSAVQNKDYYVSKTNGLLDKGIYHFNADGTMEP